MSYHTDPIAQLLRRLEEVERRVRRVVYFGSVSDVDKDKRLVRVDDGMGTEDGEVHKTDWLPWSELAGKGSGSLSTKTLPVVGQQVCVLSPSGSPEQGLVIPHHFTDENTKPDADDDDYVRKNGDGAVSRMKGKEIEHKIGDNVSIKLTENSIVLKLGSSEIEIKDGVINVVSGKIVTVGKTYLGEDSKDSDAGEKVVTEGGPAKQVWAPPA